MKKFILSLLISLFVINCFSSTTVPGGIVSGTWTLAGSPYLVQGAIMVANGTQLTIEPGVRVEFHGSFKFLVMGQLLAIGTATDSIFFTAADTTTGWLGIRFESTASTNDTSKFSYCKFKYGKATGADPLDCGGAFYITGFSKILITNSLITRCSANGSGGGIYCINGGFTILNSTVSYNKAMIVTGSYGGGGICCKSGFSVIISNNLITKNKSLSFFGGGISCLPSTSALISHNMITNNTARDYGGGIEVGSNVTFSNNTVSGNSVTSVYGGGGGVDISGINTVASNNTIINNTCNNDGGGVYCGGGDPVITNNTISNNFAVADGGAMYIGYSLPNPSISNNMITNNSASYGGGIAFEDNSTPTISNNVISNNSATNGGGALYFKGITNSVSTNNTVSNNSAAQGGALYFTSSTIPAFYNCIFWGNNATTGNQAYIFDQGSKPDFYNCDVQGGQLAFGCNTNVFYLGNYSNSIDADPKFVAASSGSGTSYNGLTANWSLSSGSPCINTGYLGGFYPATDIAGNPRIFEDIIDMGAYEYNKSDGIVKYNSSGSMAVYPNPAASYIVIETINRSSVEISNIEGQIIKTFESNGSMQTISVSDLSSGVYIIRAKTNNEIFINKFIKQ